MGFLKSFPECEKALENVVFKGFGILVRDTGFEPVTPAV